MTGAPKLRAIELIDRLEGAPRPLRRRHRLPGTATDAADLSIAIRTIVNSRRGHDDRRRWRDHGRLRRPRRVARAALKARARSRPSAWRCTGRPRRACRDTTGPAASRPPLTGAPLAARGRDRPGIVHFDEVPAVERAAGHLVAAGRCSARPPARYRRRAPDRGPRRRLVDARARARRRRGDLLRAGRARPLVVRRRDRRDRRRRLHRLPRRRRRAHACTRSSRSTCSRSGRAPATPARASPASACR